MPEELNLKALIAWQMDLANTLIIQGILEGRDMASEKEVDRIAKIVFEKTKTEFGIE